MTGKDSAEIQVVPDGELARFRIHPGPLGWLQRALLILLTLSSAGFALDIHTYFGKVIFREQAIGLFLGLVLASVFLGMPSKRASSKLPWYDGLLACLGIILGLNIAVRYPILLYEQAFATPDKWILGGIAVLLVLEATRRIAGWALVVIIGFFIFYARFAALFPGILYGKEVPWERLFTYLYLDTNSLLGLPLGVVVSDVLAFILLGQALYVTGGSEFFIDFAMSAMGRFRGGPAKMSVFSSSLFGTISGSAVANVVVDGVITIPMMKAARYPAHMAGAIEAVTSTGGQLVPPVMGATAFLIAEFLGISYGKVVLAAIIPALLYYLILFIQIDLEAAKLGLKRIPASGLPAMISVLRRGWLFAPIIGILIYTLLWLSLSAGKAGFLATGALLVLATFRKNTRPTLKKILRLCEGTGRGLLEIGVVCAAAGFVIGVLNVSGLGFGLSLGLVHLAGSNLFPLLLLTAGISIIMGMGMPTAAVYLLLVGLLAPALIQIGVPPLAAHFFIFYLGMMSMITPPVCLATYAAASIAGSDLWRTGLTGMRFGAIAYVVPFLFVYSPTLLLVGNLRHIVYDVVTAIAGAGALAVALAGYLFRPMRIPLRLLTGLAGAGMIVPTGLVGSLWLPAMTFGAALFGVIALVQWSGLQREEGRLAPTGIPETVTGDGSAGPEPEREAL
ncbi:MAG TPA: TRAP transporter fused permease subunit [bacterium]|nr:TRAP transporter fused permease subunit [bacterium]